MPSIATSTMELSTPVVSLPGATSGGAPAPIVAPPIVRAILPPGQVFDPITLAGLPGNVLPVYKNNNVATAITARVTPLYVPPPVVPSTTTSESADGVPGQVNQVSAYQLPYSNGEGFSGSLVAVSYAHWSTDIYFGGVQIWLTGYNEIAAPQLMAESQGTPVEFACLATGETVTVHVVAYSPSGVTVPFDLAPTCTVLLSGVMNPPPPPTIYQWVTAVGSTGWQFSWNVESGLLQDIVTGYWVYKNSTGVLPVSPADRVAFVAQPPNNTGTGSLVYSDTDSTVEYFWVSAMADTLESTLTEANRSTATATLLPTTTSGISFSAIESGWGTASTSQSGTWSGFPAFTEIYTGAALQVLMDMTIIRAAGVGPQCTGLASITYTLNGGTSWLPLYSRGGGSQGKGYISVSLPLAQDMTQIQVKGACFATQGGVLPPGFPTYPSPVPSAISIEMDIYAVQIALTGVS